MAKPSLIAFSILLLAVGLLSAQPRAQALCPRFGGSLEKSGVVAALQKAGKVIPAEYSDARLSAMSLGYVTVCSVEFYSASHRQRLIVIMEANLSWRTAEPATSQRVLPDGLVDLPTAIDAAVKQGMRLPLNSAKLMMAQPRGKPAVAVWTLCPRADPQGRVLCYFVSAADAGHPLKLSDVTDYFQDYNSQWRYIVDLFRGSQQPGQPQSQPVIGDGAPCLHCLSYGTGTAPICNPGIWRYGYLPGVLPTFKQWYCSYY